ncbi:Phosphate permease component of ATP-dependent phosphate uptake system [Nitrospira sp. KM1]|uniref:phosphate ABC transporter permease PstA n=1 Tax=Nitrospira sp. KM1 TaxID=1936990 RepID=UPI0013A72D7D|nr:phosphate ABC transporter permease PstA [Nitrospira sp. KM1]BCA52877.1 Phosphate permease component of ATP-dependent phosphate uptake system [Nitrospira sp. KM1]
MSSENAIGRSIELDTKRSRLWRRKGADLLFAAAALAAMLAALIVLLALLGQLLFDGAGRLTWQFVTSFPSRFPEQAGIISAWMGTLLVMFLTALTAVPLGLGAAIYLEEYAPSNRLTDVIEINIANLAGVPSIVYGLMALGLLVYEFRLGQSFLTAGLTLAMLILPMVIIASREAIRAVPPQIREAAYALGATKWQTVKDHVLPYSMGGILTGLILALSRAVGETAPLITVGALSFIAFLPHPPIQSDPPFISFQWLFDPFTVMPIQMFNWVSRPQEAFHVNAAAAGLVLLGMTLLMNAAAIVIRNRFRKRVHW